MNQKAKATLGEQRYQLLVAMVEIVVKAAEQSGLTGAINNAGSTKRIWAVNELKKWLASMGWTDLAENTDMLINLIEAAIRDGLQNPVEDNVPA